MTLTPEHDYEEVPTSGRRRKITKFALAGVAVLGVGAALTSAAWSDDVFFAGSAETGTLDLQGMDINGAWVDADGTGVTIALPSDAFNNVGPQISDSHRIRVYNNGTLDIALNAAEVSSAAGDLFEGDANDGNLPTDESAAIDIGDWSRDTLRPGQQAWADVTVTGGDWDDDEYQGATGVLEIHVQGVSVATP